VADHAPCARLVDRDTALLSAEARKGRVYIMLSDFGLGIEDSHGFTLPSELILLWMYAVAIGELLV